jgi:hypothetical protein
MMREGGGWVMEVIREKGKDRKEGGERTGEL